MDIDFVDFERAMTGEADLGLLFDLIGSGFRPESPAPLPLEPVHDEPQPSGSSTEDEEEVVEQGAVDPLASPAAAGSNLCTPRSEIDRPDYDEPEAVADNWNFCNAWVGAVNFCATEDTRIRVPAYAGGAAFDDIRDCLEEQALPAIEKLCRILLARILYAWDISVRCAKLRAEGAAIPRILETSDDFEPNANWVWGIFGPLDSCDRVDVPTTVSSGSRVLELTITTPAWIWWYIDLVFVLQDGHLVPRAWTEANHIAEHEGAVVIDEDDFKYVILAGGVGALYKRHMQTRRTARFFAGQHPVCMMPGMDGIFCLTFHQLGGAFSTLNGANRQAVMRRTTRKRSASRMRARRGMFEN